MDLPPPVPSGMPLVAAPSILRRTVSEVQPRPILVLSPRRSVGCFDESTPLLYITPPTSGDPVNVIFDEGAGLKSTGIVCGARGICDSCKIGIVRKELAWPWVILAILLFPVGLIFVCCMRKRCAVCGLHF